MNEPTRRDALRELAEKPTANLRVSTLVRQRLNDIEAAQANGHSNTQIVEAINQELGVSIKLKTFEQALWRIRNPKTGKKQRSVTPEPTGTSKAVQRVNSPETTLPDTPAEAGESTEMDAIREALNNQHRETKMQQYEKPQKKLGAK